MIIQKKIGILLLSLSFATLSCVEKAKTQSPTVSPKTKTEAVTKPKEISKSIDVTPVTGPNARDICARPKSITKNPATFEDVVTLINALPKPVSVACALDTLDPPFYLNATSNQFSGQPSGGKESPRMFLFLGKALVLSVVPTGLGSTMIEMSYRLSEEESIKGELAFPVRENLTLEEPYTHILTRANSETLCISCHFPEKPAPEGFPKTAFVSRWVSAMDDYDVSIPALQKLNDQCKTEVAEHCEIIQAIFRRGRVYARGFEL